MIEHHRGAIAMSRVALAQATDADTKRMAQMTIDMQEKDIGELHAIHGRSLGAFLFVFRCLLLRSAMITDRQDKTA